MEAMQLLTLAEYSADWTIPRNTITSVRSVHIETVRYCGIALMQPGRTFINVWMVNNIGGVIEKTLNGHIFISKNEKKL